MTDLAQWLKYGGTAALCLSAGLAVYYSLKEKPRQTVLRKPSAKECAQVLALFLGIRLLLLLLTLFMRQGITGSSLFPTLSDALNRWDAPHYLWIAENGYQGVTPDSDGYLFIVFFPLYPWLVSVLGGSAEAGILLNCVLSAATSLVIYLWSLSRGDSRTTAFMSAAFWQFFPLSVFQMAPYTESLFVLLTTATLFALSRRCFLAAGILGFLATLCRNAGVLLLIPAGIELLLAAKNRPLGETVRDGTWLLLIPIGMLVYLGINDWVYGDPFMFMKIQKSHWYQGFGFFGDTIRYITENFLNGDGATRWYLWGSEWIAILATLASVPLLLREMSPAERAYTLIYIVFILSPTWLLSYPRYLMGLAPLYGALGCSFFAGGKLRASLGCLLLAVFAAAMLLMTYGLLSGQQVL